MERKIDIHKAGGVLLRDRKFLVTRSKGKDIFVAPGGKLEKSESAQEALVRELKEELGITVNQTDFAEFGVFYAPAAGDENKYVQIDVFIVKNWVGDINPSGEVEEILWINSSLNLYIKLGSIFEHEVLPRLKQSNLID